MATGLISLLGLSLSPDLRRRVSNVERLARAGGPGVWSRRSVMDDNIDKHEMIT